MAKIGQCIDFTTIGVVRINKAMRCPSQLSIDVRIFVISRVLTFDDSVAKDIQFSNEKDLVNLNSIQYKII